MLGRTRCLWMVSVFALWCSFLLGEVSIAVALVSGPATEMADGTEILVPRVNESIAAPDVGTLSRVDIASVLAPIYTGVRPGWTRQVGEDCSDLVVSEQGDIYITAMVGGLPAVGHYRSDGTRVWLKTVSDYGGGYYSSLGKPSIEIDSSGNVVAAFGVWVPYAGGGFEKDVVVTKLTQSGETLWTRMNVGDSSTNYDVVDLCIDASDSAFVVGFGAAANGQGHYDYYVTKNGPDGDRRWVRYYDTGSMDGAFETPLSGDIPSDATLDSTRLLVTGSGGSGLFTVCVDTLTGETLWQRVWHSDIGSTDYAYSVDTDAVGRAYVTGMSVGDGSRSCITLGYETDGSLRWVNRFENGGRPTGGTVVRCDTQGAVYVGGAAWGGNYDQGGTQWDMLAHKISADGVTEWSRKWANPDRIIMEQVYDAEIDASGGFYTTGGGIGGDVTTLCYSPSGDIVWKALIDQGNTDLAYSLEIAPNSGRVVVAGSGFPHGQVGILGSYPPNESHVLMSTSSGTIGYAASKVLSGTLASATPVSGKKVWLQASPDGQKWSSTGLTSMTDSKGRFTFTVRPSAKTYYRVHFYGNLDYRPCFGPRVMVYPRVYLTKGNAPKTMYAGSAKKVTGYLKPRHASGSTRVQIKLYKYSSAKGKYVYKSHVHAKLANYSTYSKWVKYIKFPSKGKWRIRAYMPADSKHAATYSSWDYVTVK